MWDALQAAVFEDVLSYLGLMSWRIVDLDHQLSLSRISPPGKTLSTKGTKFRSMSHDVLKDAAAGNTITTWNP
jgi:hypothetical protein